MGKKKKYAVSLKDCENIHDFMKNRLNIRSHHRKRTRFHHNDMPIYLEERGIMPPDKVDYDCISQNMDNDRFILVKDDYNNIRYYRNPLALDEKRLLRELQSAKDKLEQRRIEVLKSIDDGYGYDPITGEVRPLSDIALEDYLYSFEPTEKLNRQKVKSKIRNYGGR